MGPPQRPCSKSRIFRAHSCNLRFRHHNVVFRRSTSAFHKATCINNSVLTTPICRSHDTRSPNNSGVSCNFPPNTNSLSPVLQLQTNANTDIPNMTPITRGSARLESQEQTRLTKADPSSDSPRRRIKNKSSVLRRSARLLNRIASSTPKGDPPIPSIGLNLLDLPPEIILNIADFMHDPKSPYIFQKKPNFNWKLTIRRRPGHKTGGKATINPRRYGCQILFLIRPHAVLAKVHPCLEAILKPPPKPVVPMPLDVFDRKKGFWIKERYWIQEQEGQGIMQEGWGTVTEESQRDKGYEVEWPMGIRMVL